MEGNMNSEMETKGDQNRIGASTASENAEPKYKDVELRVKQADNGVIVEAIYEPCYYKEEWVFKNMAEASAQFDSIMSVVQTKGKEKEMENKKNKGGNSGMMMED